MKCFGHLVFQRIPTQLYDLGKVKQAFEDAGIPTHHIPHSRGMADAFAKACSKTARSWKNQTDATGKDIRVRITAVENNDDYLQRDIVQETVRGKQGKDNYAQNTFVGSVLKLIFRKQVASTVSADDKQKMRKVVSVQMNGKTPAQLVKDGTWAPGIDYGAMAHEIITLAETMCENTVDDQAIRKTMIATLKGHAAAVPYMDFRGVMLVPDGKSSEMKAISRAANDLGIMMHSVPIYESADVVKEMVGYLAKEFISDMEVLREQVGTETSFRRKDARAKMKREISRFEELVREYESSCPKDVRLTLQKELFKTKMTLDTAEKDREIAAMRAESAKIRKQNKDGVLAKPTRRDTIL